MCGLSCRKEEVVIDREDNLSSDTALIIYSSQYNSHTASALNVTVEILQMNGLVSESDYSGAVLADANIPDHTVTFGTTTTNTNTPIASYSTIFVFDYAETISFKDEFAGFYLRRFFEIVDSLPNRNVALSSFSAEENTPTRLHTENNGNIFDNSWEFNLQQFYERTIQLDESANQTQGQYIKDRLIDLMDSLLAAPQATGELSITLLTGNGGYNFSASADLDAIIDYALLNNIKINVITPGGSYELAQIANETGGFLSAWVGDEQGQPQPGGPEFSNTQIALQNLDDLLMSKVTTHKIDITDVQTDIWQSGSIARIEFIYNQHLLSVQFRIP